MFTMTWKSINKYSSLLFILAVILAILLPDTAKLFHPLLIYLLVPLLFLGFIKIDFSIVKSELVRWRYQLYLIALTALLLPTINYLITIQIINFTKLPSSFAIAVLLIYSSPTAAATPTLCMLLKGRLERAMLNVIATSLLAPITISVLFYLLIGNTVTLPFMVLIRFIGIIIILPFIASMILRKTVPQLRTKMLPIVQPLSIILLFLLMFGASSILHSLIFNSATLALKGLLLIAGLFIFTFIAGWLLSFKKRREEKITVAMISSWTNLGLAIVIANQFFQTTHPQVIFLVIIATVIWNIAIVLATSIQNLLRHRDLNNIN